LRLVICELIDEGVLFLGQNTYKLENPYVFDTAFLSLMERLAGLPFLLHLYSSFPSDPTDELLMIIGIFSHFFAVETTLAERQFFRALAKLIGRRAARLSACGIAAIVSKMGYLDEGCSVGADGSLYNVSVPPFSCLNPLLNEIFLVRNILDLQIGYMKVWSTFSAREEGWFLPMKVREFALTK
jgi:hexokinase